MFSYVLEEQKRGEKCRNVHVCLLPFGLPKSCGKAIVEAAGREHV